NSRFEVSFSPPKNATLGLYDLRVRVNDTASLLSDWFILNDTLLVLNNFPNLVDLKLSNSNSIQNKNVTLCVNGTDIEDPENNLTIEMMYRDPNEQSWNVTFLGTPKYFDNKWVINFSANFSAPFGNYDFRVRVNDSDGNFSKWSYKNDSLLIYNLNPEVLDIKLSKNIIFRTESVDLYVNGSDYENLESTLTFSIQYKSNLDGIWKDLNGSYINNRWQATFTAGIGAALGSYDFRARFQDINNGISKWQYLNDSLNVQNNPPLIEDLLLSKSNAKLSDTVKIWVNGNDIEEPEDNLTVILRYRDPNEQSWDGSYISSAKYIGDKWEFEFDMPYDAPFGYYDFKARLNDSDGSFTEWIYNNDSLLIYNTPPSVLDIILSKSSIKRTETMYLAVNGIDYETPESMLSIYIQYKPNAKIDWIDLSGEYSNDNASWETRVLTTIDSDLDYYDFRVKFEDNETLSSGWVYLNDSFEVLNNLPEISNELDEINITTEPKLIDLTQYESDIEDNDEDLIWSVDDKEYNYLESITITDTINDILKINPLDNVTGDVDIKLILTDKDDGTTTKSDITLHIDSRRIEFKPKVTLLSPPDKATINTLTPTLRWELDYSGTDSIKYTVTLDDNPDPLTTIKTGLTTAEYTLEN
ncbi:MAG: hypothetical protein KAJ51_02205, partial [Thermoplasmata archaeon]|nr:hypothetical protein [Thermoplasmata archaeon]